MFVLFFILSLGASLIPLAMLIFGKNKKETSTRKWPWPLLLPAFTIAAWVLFGKSMGIISESIWFDQLGQADRYWRVFWVKFYIGAMVFTVVSLFSYLNFKYVEKKMVSRTYMPEIISLSLGIIFSLSAAGLYWENLILYFGQLPGNVIDPFFGLNESFYLFTFPIYNKLVFLLQFYLLILFACLKLFVLGWEKKIESMRWDNGERYQEKMIIFRSAKPAFAKQYVLLIALVFFLLACSWYLAKYELLYSSSGAVRGMGYADYYYWIPAYYILAVLYALMGIILLAATFKGQIFSWFNEKKKRIWVSVCLFLLANIIIMSFPAIAYIIKVKPNEKALEAAFIPHSQKMTRHAYGLQKENVAEEEYPVKAELTREVMAANQKTLSNVRIWDYHALQATLGQTQEMKQYYEFYDVDIDRYEIKGESRQVMVAVREFELSQLTDQANTWINRHFTYTHGHGLTVNPVNSFLKNGSPDFWVKDVPAVSIHEELELERPEIYFGELTNHHIYVKTTKEEFDYPSGDQNVYTTYEGLGGIKIKGFWRKLALAWKFDGHRLYLSDYFTDESRIIYRRNILKMAEAIVPFLSFDEDPYAVIYNGGITWILDAYTTSRYFPNSENYGGINYIRNSVKVAINAYDGKIVFYAFDPDDPILKTYAKVFPDMFMPSSEMPEGLKKHIRYPEKMFSIQYEAFRKYHIDDVENFYNQEDVWDRATELYRNNPIPVEPYFVNVQLEGMDSPEFMLIAPYTVKGKDRMTGWLSGMCDGKNYGKLRLFKFPKGQFIAGPQQVESKIGSNEKISPQLTLWDQRGSEVIRGNLIILPLIGNVLVAFEPIFLQGETAQMPAIARVVAVQILPGDQRVVWNTGIESALSDLLQNGRGYSKKEAEERARDVMSNGGSAGTAVEYVQRYRELVGAGKFSEAGSVLENLFDLLENKGN